MLIRYISHKMEEIFQIADDVTVMRDGKVIGTFPVKDLTGDRLISLMVGRDITHRFPPVESEIGEVCLEVRNLSAADPRSFKNISFRLKKGEILGIGGLVGAQRTELVEAIFGVRAVSGGEILVNGKPLKKIRPQEAIKSGIGLVTEDRRSSGIFPLLNITVIPTYESALYYGYSFPLFVPIVAGILAGGVFGLFNGTLVAYGKLPPFIATLGTMSLARGIQLIYTRAAIVGSLNANFKALAQSSLFSSIPFLGIYVLIITILVWVLLKHTKQGTNFYAIGGNAQAARVSGINVERDLVCVYFYAGLLYGCAGVLQAGRLGLANALTANGMELDAIAAVTVGGVSQNGGVGTVMGMIIGVFTMGLINYGMSFLSIDSYYQLLVKGSIIIIAVFFDMKKYAKRA